MNRYGDHKTSLLHSGMCMYLFDIFFDNIHFINKYHQCLGYMKCLYELGFNVSSFHYSVSLVIGH